MKCPVDSATLLLSNRQNIEIDYCPECRGVWLDRGELDKLIDSTPSTQASSNSYLQPAKDESYRKQDFRGYPEPQNHHKKKRESFLSDLFDF